MRTTYLARTGAVVLAASAALVAVPDSALAASCGDDGATQLFDPSGSYFDFTEAGAAPDHDQPYATLYDGGNNGPAGTPPGPRGNSDAFDDWGALFVGGIGLADMYFSVDNGGCADEDGGHVYPVVSLHGLQVQRKIFVRPNAQTGGLPGARILNLLTNPGSTAVTTTVQVGDNLSGDSEGDVGSDSATAVRSSSSGDLSALAGDRWFVTSDHSNAAGTESSDPAIAFVVDGPTGVDAASTIQVGGGTDATPEDNVVWTWQVTVRPGETVALMSFAVQADVASGPTQAAQADALAADLARAYQSAPVAQLYAGMSATEIAALRNWNDLEVTGRITAGKQKLGRTYSASVTCPEEACRVSLSGRLKVGTKSFRLRPAQAQAAGGVATTVTLKLLKKKDLRKVMALIAAKPQLAKKVKVTFTGTVADLTGTATQPLDLTSKVKVRKPKG